jgi:hypothetical protein
MKRRERAYWSLRGALALLVLCSPVLRGAELKEADFLVLHGQLQPPKNEPWRTIPWKITLIDAQRIAIQEKKPIFIWAMDGHPLGCT